MYLYHLVYFSKRKAIDPVELAKILATARRNNAALGVTGALFADDTYFFQVLEGPRTTLSLLLHTIMNDNRHEDVVLTLFEATEHRMFGAWTMVDISSEDPAVRASFQAHMSDLDTPAMMPGPHILDMLETMAGLSLSRAPTEKLM